MLLKWAAAQTAAPNSAARQYAFVGFTSCTLLHELQAFHELHYLFQVTHRSMWLVRLLETLTSSSTHEPPSGATMTAARGPRSGARKLI